MSLLVPPRRPAREILDDPRLPADEMERSLRDLALVNRRWGGSGALARLLVRRLEERGGRRARLLDVGAGSGDVSRRLAARLHRAGFEATVVGVDLQWRHLAAGRRISATPLPAAAADGFRLPFESGAFDWTVSTLVFHHFSPEENVRFLRELARVSRDGFAILDLRRHVLPLFFVAVAGRLLFQSPVSVRDGVVSVRQAYTPEEAREIAARAIEGSRVRKVFPFRLMISREAA